ncbi:unnamed protein product [Clonostachys chloroleuca]|uniref:AB hydrolase-1 domain-containing protein n=1 Tax=Clonostachys chloroleuca TaxID=1926264 RepID=A0AA35M348_9HYPO|nr:unnamed protein product [Clonostachys chloroleuca]
MVGTSTSDYIFIRTSIILLHLVAPLSVAYSLASSLGRLPFQPPRVLHVWLILEAVFYLVIYLPRKKYLQRAARHPALPCRDDRRKLFWRCHRNIPDPVQYLRKWFRGASEEEIKRDNVKDFFRWAFLSIGEPDSAYDEEIEEYTEEMEKLLGRRLEPGRGNASCLRLTLEKVEMLHRSLTWYLCIFIVDTTTSIYMRFHSFHFYRPSFLRFLYNFPLRILTLLATNRSPASNLTYWHRPHTSKTKLPILFIHGIGVGLYPYINFLADLNTSNGEDRSDGQVGVIAIEIMSISSRITAEAMSKDEMCNEIQVILKAHGWDKVVLITHSRVFSRPYNPSYGSIVAAYLLRHAQMAQTIGPVFFIDPVSFLLHLPDVIYRKPSRPNEYLLSYFGSKDMGVSHTLFRRFFWADGVLWKEDIQSRRVSVALAGRDIVTNAEIIRAYLTSSDDWFTATGGRADGLWRGDCLDVLWFQDLDHGQAFDEKETRSRLIQVAKDLCRE